MNVCANSPHSRRSQIAEQAPSGEALENTHRCRPISPTDSRTKKFTSGSRSSEQDVPEGRHLHGLPRAAQPEAASRQPLVAVSNAETFRHEKASFSRDPKRRCAMRQLPHPQRTYMTVELAAQPLHSAPRHVPAVGSPNTCAHCRRKAQWATKTMDGWYRQSVARWSDRCARVRCSIICRARTLPDLLAIAKDHRGRRTSAGAVAGAEACHAEIFCRTAVVSRRSGSAGADPLRSTGWQLQPQQRMSIAGKLLADETRAVRITAASALTGIPDTMFPDSMRGSRVHALQEYVNARWR